MRASPSCPRMVKSSACGLVNRLLKKLPTFPVRFDFGLVPIPVRPGKNSFSAACKGRGVANSPGSFFITFHSVRAMAPAEQQPFGVGSHHSTTSKNQAPAKPDSPSHRSSKAKQSGNCKPEVKKPNTWIAFATIARIKVISQALRYFLFLCQSNIFMWFTLMGDYVPHNRKLFYLPARIARLTETLSLTGFLRFAAKNRRSLKWLEDALYLSAPD
jgi:hypothetical protein